MKYGHLSGIGPYYSARGECDIEGTGNAGRLAVGSGVRVSIEADFNLREAIVETAICK